ncbi:DUF829 domain-containing protein [Chloropicon primus]|uniref:DUF829 domain-containing protein n=1 Tax=Chloropicon primus TaxID=1764295 RepID=A0A5B8MCJ4_9CHLO|nr:DUF829 domain-containing protein [Chloropicon primus]UPQ97067.1 DUF829 domain-containing protein [Chloropicon primus]|eukprot:QDZ17851.1 DUF829 domain-containing protein [Chloropicon primus]
MRWRGVARVASPVLAWSVGQSRRPLNTEAASFRKRANAPSVSRAKDVSVICVGWFGSQQRHLDKYCETWRKIGVKRVICYSPSVKAILLRRFCEREARKFLQNLPKPEGKVVWHLFSQGGFTFFGSVLQEDLKCEIKDSVAAVVFDCGPSLGLTREDAVVGVLTGVLKAKDEETALSVYNRKWFKTFWDNGWAVYDRMIYGDWNASVLRSFGSLEKAKQFYLYSAEDKVIGYRAIEEFISRQEEGGKKVALAKKWETGKHVNLLREHENEYVCCLQTIYNDVLLQ